PGRWTVVAHGQQAASSRQDVPEPRAGTTTPEKLLARGRVPASDQRLLVLRPAGVFLAMVRAEHDQRLAVGGQAHGTTPLICVRPVGVLKFDNVAALAGGRIRDPQALVEPGRVQQLAIRRKGDATHPTRTLNECEGLAC